MNFSYLFTIALLFILTSTFPAWGEDPALQLADHLFAQQSYVASITEYKRFIFFNSGDERVADAYYQIALAYRAEKDWARSVEAFRKSIQYTSHPHLKDERRIELGITLTANGQYYYALSELMKVSQFSKDHAMRRKASYFQGVAYLYTFNWERARQAFYEFYSTATTPRELEVGKRIDALLREAQRLPYKSERVATVLSIILPGAGQSYTGAWKEGLNALLLNGLITFFMVDTALKKDYLDTSLLFLFIFNRYYFGNCYQAEEAVKRFNNRFNRRQANKILSTLLE